MTDRRIPPAPDRGQERGQASRATGVRRRTHLEEIQAVYEEEARLGRPMSQREREAFVLGFHGQEYGDEIRRLMELGVEEPSDAEDEG